MLRPKGLLLPKILESVSDSSALDNESGEAQVDRSGSKLMRCSWCAPGSSPSDNGKAWGSEHSCLASTVQRDDLARLHHASFVRNLIAVVACPVRLWRHGLWRSVGFGSIECAWLSFRRLRAERIHPSTNRDLRIQVLPQKVPLHACRSFGGVLCSGR
jgi:hypothetical protein